MSLQSFVDPPVCGDRFTTDHGGLHSFDGTEAAPFKESDVAEVLYHGHSGEDWDGTEAAVIRLNDGRIVAWQSDWGPTGSGFCLDAYGGDAEVWFARPENLNRLVLQALTDQGRRLCGIPADGLGCPRIMSLQSISQIDYITDGTPLNTVVVATLSDGIQVDLTPTVRSISQKKGSPVVVVSFIGAGPIRDEDVEVSV